MIVDAVTPVLERSTRPVLRDSALPQLPAVTDLGTVESLLAPALGAPVTVSSAELLRHKPGRRALLRYRAVVDGTPRTLYGKAFASNRGPNVFAALRALHHATAGTGPRIPEPIAVVPALRLLVMGEVRGQPVEAALLAGDVAAGERIAEALHRLHRSGARLPRHHAIIDELEPLRERTQRLAARIPAVAALAAECLTLSERRAPRFDARRSMPIHRDCYPAQVLADPTVGLLDLDDAAMSEPAVDVANFAAHLRLAAVADGPRAEGADRSREAFVAAYHRLDEALDPALVGYLEGVTLLRLAEIHGTRAGGERLAPRLLEMSRWLLDRTA